MSSEAPQKTNVSTQPQIHIRQYRNSDFDDTRKIFLDFLVGDDSPFTLVMNNQFTAPLSLTSYALISIGLGLVLLLPSSSNPTTITQNKIIGLALSVLGLSIICYSRYSLRSMFNQYVARSLKGDMANIGKHYGVDINAHIDASEGNGNGENDASDVKGKSGFWVAEADWEHGHRREDDEKEIVGCVGLDPYTNNDPASAELRRLVISPKYRRRGIAQQLLKAAIDHARKHDIKNIFLTTSSYQMPAIKMYQKLGFNVEEIREVSVQMGQKIQIYAFRLDVENFRG